MNKTVMRKILSRNIDTVTLFFCQKPSTGYGVIGEVEKVFGVRLGAGVVYGCLMRLERDGLLSHEMVNGAHGTRQACSYVVTEKGKTMFQCNVEQLRVILKFVGC
jgi:DNA-binding PadR family transcriptional regulator